MAIITSFINWKGGVGKTTLTYHIAIGLVRERKKVLLIDLDPQCNLSYLTGGHKAYVHKVYEKQTPTVKNIFDAYFYQQPIRAKDLILTRSVASSPGNVYNHLDLLFSHTDLSLLDVELTRYEGNDLDKLSILKNFLDQVADDYDYVLIDCPPNVSLVTQNAFFASHRYIVPAIPDYLSTVGISLIRKKMRELNCQFASLCQGARHPFVYEETMFGGVIFNKVEEYGGVPKNAHRQFFTLLQENGDNMLFANYLIDGTGMALAAQHHLPIFSFEHFAKGNQNVQKQVHCLEQITLEFLTRIGPEVRV